MQTDVHEKWMLMALDDARAAASEGEIPVGAVVVKDGVCIARGHNMRESTLDPTAHAEIVAMRRAAQTLETRRLHGCTLYVTMEPCPMCAGAIVLAGLDRVVYGAPDPQMGCAGSVYRLTEDPAFTHYCKADGGVCAAQCSEVLDTFFRNKRQ